MRRGAEVVSCAIRAIMLLPFMCYTKHHVLALADPMEGFRLRVDEVGHG